MAGKAPGRYWREGLTSKEFHREICPDNEAAEAWFIAARWPDRVRCPRCDGDNVYEPGGKAPMRFRCRPCRRFFSTKTGTVMEHSNISYEDWLIAMYYLTVGIKGQSSRRLARDVGITQRSAWHLAHRIREGWVDGSLPFTGIVEVDETLIGGIEKNKHSRKKLPSDRWVWHGESDHLGKAIVVGAKERGTRRLKAKMVTGADRVNLRTFIRESVKLGTTLHTDHQPAYDRIPGYPRHAVNHSAKEYVRGNVHTNGIESAWAFLKRIYMGTYHSWSKKHMHRYLAEFTGRHNVRDEGTVSQLLRLTRGMEGKRLRYYELTAE